MLSVGLFVIMLVVVFNQLHEVKQNQKFIMETLNARTPVFEAIKNKLEIK